MRLLLKDSDWRFGRNAGSFGTYVVEYVLLLSFRKLNQYAFQHRPAVVSQICVSASQFVIPFGKQPGVAPAHDFLLVVIVSIPAMFGARVSAQILRKIQSFRFSNDSRL